LFISFVPGIWVGAVFSLALGIILSRKAILIHQQASPFRKSVDGEEPGGHDKIGDNIGSIEK